MKKIVFVAILVLALTACGPSMFLTASDIAKQVKMGMTIDQFEKLAGDKAQMFELNLDGVVFSIDDWNAVGQITGYKLFHFNGQRRLFRVETRRLQPIYRAAPPAPQAHQAPVQQHSMWD